MPDYSAVLNLFSDQEIVSRVETILAATESIAHKEPTYGFHHKYYMPGWIGLIQQRIVEKKMAKFTSQPFYDGKNYLEYANWLIEQSKSIADLQLQYKPENNLVDEQYEKQCKSLRDLFNLALELWIDACPEIAMYCNQQYDENTLLSPAGVVQNAYSTYLGPIGYVVLPSNKKRKFTEEVKSSLYHLAGLILNFILLFLIYCLISWIVAD